jgi:hypothetical protein
MLASFSGLRERGEGEAWERGYVKNHVHRAPLSMEKEIEMEEKKYLPVYSLNGTCTMYVHVAKKTCTTASK